jgi:DNA-binding CsgD family transcriptional regulator
MLDDAVRELGEHIEFDALIAGSGIRESDGSVTISKVLGFYGINRAFIDEYPGVAREDVVGQLFAAYPRVVQVISVEEYRNLGKGSGKAGNTSYDETIPGARARKHIADYLDRNGIRHLMLSGIDSSFGLAWITFYRKNHDPGFSAIDAEWARYIVPSLLYRWQHHAQSPLLGNVELPTKLLPLTAREMQVVFLDLEGMRTKAIAERLQLSESYVKTVIRNIRTRLGVVGRKMTPDDFEKYGGPVQGM